MLLLLDRSDPKSPPMDVKQILESPPDRNRRIRCPRCSWQPDRRSLWSCHCGHAWNTFDTAALCPKCGKQWEHTQCLRCHVFSPHRDWYENPDPDAQA